MKNPLFSFLFSCLFCTAAFAQQSPKPQSREVFGIIVDSTGTVPAVNVKLISASDSITVTSNLKGVYDFPIVTSKTFKITVTGIGYQPFTRRYVMEDGTKPIKLDPIRLKSQTNMLNT